MLHFCLLLFIASQKEIGAEEIALISYVIFFTIVIVMTFVIFFTVFQKRKNELLLHQIEQKQKFEEELLKSQQEIQEETLKYIGRELHDNVGQLLAFANMQMKSLGKEITAEIQPKFASATDAIKDGLKEVRALSKSLNSDVIERLGFNEVLKNEIDRLNNSGLIEAEMTTSGDHLNCDNEKDQTILFRIIQEFFSNTLKYAEAETINLQLYYNDEVLRIFIKDDGIGFDKNLITEGSGMTNMHKRAELIKATLTLDSKINHGTSLHITYPYRDVV